MGRPGIAIAPDGTAARFCPADIEAREVTLGQTDTIEHFLKGVERRALRMAQFATGDAGEALDLVQDAMFGLVRRYAGRAPAEWGPLFQRILQSRIQDWHRRRRVQRRLFGWLAPAPLEGDAAAPDPLESVADPAAVDPCDQLARDHAMAAVDAAVARLPLRQQQAFLLRVWEGLDTAQTAYAMGCSEGSVKTHFSRAVHALREQLEGHWP